MEIKYKVGILKNARYLDGTDADGWYLQYAVLNKQGKDYVQYGGEVEENKDKYPHPIGEESGTIFLDSSLDDIYGTTTIQNVIINSEGPSVIEDKTTRQVLNSGDEEHPTPITVKLKFKSKSPLDVLEMNIAIGTTDLVSIHRRNRPNFEVHQCVSSLDMHKNGTEYTLTMNIIPSLYSSIENLINDLNTHEITIQVFDINANGVEYKTYGEPWKYITSEDDIYDLQKLIIRFSNVIPEDMILSPNVEGECTVTVYNPNTYLWSIEPTVVLNDESIGEMQDYTYDPSTGIAKFKVKRIVEYGNVIVDAWIDVDNPKIHDIVYNATVAQGVLGPWLVEDERNRKIKLLDYPPAYLKENEYWQFVKFTEKFLNTMYMSMSKKASIGILEKVARIADFNYINDVEAKLLNHYKEHFGIELDPNVDDMRHFLLQKKIALTNNDGEIVGNADAYEDLTSAELDNFIRYVYHEIPEYNQYKGSYKGVKMALNMLGLCCKLVELWSKVDNKDVDDLRRADEINDYFMKKIDANGIEIPRDTKAAVAKLYLTSRFDVDIEEPSITFREFNGLADNICRLIFQCKPVTRLLRKLSYIYYMWTGLKFSYMWFPFYNLQQLHHFKYIFPLVSDYVRPKHEMITSMPEGYDENYNDAVPDGVITNMNKLFINHIANEAYVTYLQETDKKKWKETDELDAGTLITRTTSKNAYCNLRNIAYCAKRSGMQRIRFDIHYCYERIPLQEEDDHEGGHGLIDPYWYYIDDEGNINERPEYIYTKRSYVEGIDFTVEDEDNVLPHDCRRSRTAENLPKVMYFDLPLYDFINTIDGNPNSSNTVTIDEAKNGFYLDFHGSTNGIFVNTDSYNAEILPEFFMLKPGTVFKHSVDGIIYKYILRNLDIEIDFDIALGTDFIAQHHDSKEAAEQLKYINTIITDMNGQVHYDWRKQENDCTMCGTTVNELTPPDEDYKIQPPLALLAKESDRYT